MVCFGCCHSAAPPAEAELVEPRCVRAGGATVIGHALYEDPASCNPLSPLFLQQWARRQCGRGGTAGADRQR